MGLGSSGVLCVCAVHISACANVDVPLVLCKRMGSVTVRQFHCFDLSWCLFLSSCRSELSRYFECWLPHPQTVDTELLSHRLAEIPVEAIT